MSKIAKKLENKKIIILICMIVIIVIQCSITIHFGAQKSGFHTDEMFTYELSNYSDRVIARTDGFLDAWHDGSYYHNVMSVTPEERFNFSIPYVNQENDVHPFLYYFVVHLVCSFFPEMHWKWLGIVINLCFCILTSIFLFKLSKSITKSTALALICVIAWGWSIGAVGATVFLRMYAMLGMWCVIFSLLLTRLAQNISARQQIKKRCWIGLLLITAAGTLTQYYFLVFCFVACLIVLIYLLVKQKWRQSLFFVIAEVGGVVFAYVCFPTMMTHIFGGYRGEEAFSNFSSSESAWNNLRTVITKISNELFNGWVIEIIIICVIALVLYWLVCIFHPRFSVKGNALTLTSKPSLPKQFSISLHMNRGGIIIILEVVCICYIVIISRIAPYQEDRYYMCVFPILSMIGVYLIYTLGNFITKRKAITCILILIIVLFVTGMSYVKQTVPYLYTNCAGREEDLSRYLGYPVLVVNLASFDAAPDIWNYEFERFPAIYRCSYGSFDGVANAVETKDLSDGFLVYAQSSTLSDEEFIENLSNHIAISDWEMVTDKGTKVYFCETAD